MTDSEGGGELVDKVVVKSNSDDYPVPISQPSSGRKDWTARASQIRDANVATASRLIEEGMRADEGCVDSFPAEALVTKAQAMLPKFNGDFKKGKSWRLKNSCAPLEVSCY
ncbi:unnamed protein product [Soboliphyme baturini]|uniref:Dynein light chain n=1 Tax=Soboliphyme baturini TaxID=241478 RepID=A0A183J5J2_9BILA|nr:unnamed protein product [Soboliphyme baturini]